MAQSLSNITFSFPLQSGSDRIRKQSLFPKSPNHLNQIGANRSRPAVKAIAGENLDHLQRASNPQKRVATVAPIGLWDRFPAARTVQQMMDTMEALIDDPYEYSSPPRAPARSSGGGRTPWEIKEGEGEYKMRFDMPGMRKEDVKVWVEEKMLVVAAEKKQSGGGGGGEETEWPEKSYGRYSCRILLPENVEVEKIKAEVRDGVLYISVPKASGVSKVLDINLM